MEIALYILVALAVAGVIYWVYRAAKSEGLVDSLSAANKAGQEKIDALQTEVLEQVEKENAEDHEIVKDALAHRDAKQLGFLLRKAGRDDHN